MQLANLSDRLCGSSPLCLKCKMTQGFLYRVYWDTFQRVRVFLCISKVFFAFFAVAEILSHYGTGPLFKLLLFDPVVRIEGLSDLRLLSLLRCFIEVSR